MTAKQRDFISRLGVMAAVDGLSVGELTRSYLYFRDATLRVLDQEIARLGTPAALATEARSVVRATNDSAVVRMARAYDARMQSDKLGALVAGEALRSSETQLKAAVVDISDKNEQLMEASRQQSSFIANMSHELRTPLTGILGFTELLLEDTGSPLNNDQRMAVLEIEASGQVLLTLLNDILDERSRQGRCRWKSDASTTTSSTQSWSPCASSPTASRSSWSRRCPRRPGPSATRFG
jgi:signal transduction histidine kinase